MWYQWGCDVHKVQNVNEIFCVSQVKICKKYDTKDGNDNTLFYVGISSTCWTVTCLWELFYSEKWFCPRDGRNVCDWQIAEVVSGCLAGVMCFSQSSPHGWSKDQTLYRLGVVWQYVSWWLIHSSWTIACGHSSSCSICMKMCTKFNLAPWPRMVKFTELNISEFWFLNFSYISHHWIILKSTVISGI